MTQCFPRKLHFLLHVELSHGLKLLDYAIRYVLCYYHVNNANTRDVIEFCKIWCNCKVGSLDGAKWTLNLCFTGAQSSLLGGNCTDRVNWCARFIWWCCWVHLHKLHLMHWLFCAKLWSPKVCCSVTLGFWNRKQHQVYWNLKTSLHHCSYCYFLDYVDF